MSKILTFPNMELLPVRALRRPSRDMDPDPGPKATGRGPLARSIRRSSGRVLPGSPGVHRRRRGRRKMAPIFCRQDFPNPSVPARRGGSGDGRPIGGEDRRSNGSGRIRTSGESRWRAEPAGGPGAHPVESDPGSSRSTGFRLPQGEAAGRGRGAVGRAPWRSPQGPTRSGSNARSRSD